MTDVADTLKKTSAYLQPNPTARLDAEILLAHCLGVDRTSLFREPERKITASEEEKLLSMISERKNGRPIAQLVGKVEFFSMEFRVNDAVLCPRADTELLVEQAIDLIGNTPSRVIDLGTGSAAIAISVATHCPNSTVYAVELCGQAISVAKANLKTHQLGNLHLIRAEWLDAIGKESIDIVISNPPYIESDDPHLINTSISFEPTLALDGGPDGMRSYRKMMTDIPRVLKPNGRILLEHGYRQGLAIRQLLEQTGLTQITTLKDLEHRERVSSGVFRQLNAA